MQSSSVQPTQPPSDDCMEPQSSQMPGACGDHSTEPKFTNRGSVGRNSVVPVMYASNVPKRPWTTMSLAMPRDHYRLAVFAAVCWCVYMFPVNSINYIFYHIFIFIFFKLLLHALYLFLFSLVIVHNVLSFYDQPF